MFFFNYKRRTDLDSNLLVALVNIVSSIELRAEDPEDVLALWSFGIKVMRKSHGGSTRLRAEDTSGNCWLDGIVSESGEWKFKTYDVQRYSDAAFATSLAAAMAVPLWVALEVIWWGMNTLLS